MDDMCDIWGLFKGFGCQGGKQKQKDNGVHWPVILKGWQIQELSE